MNFNGLVMKTGHNSVLESIDDTHIIKNILILLGIFINDAVKLGGVYCMHSNRKIVKKRDIELALKTRAYHGDSFWNSPSITEKIKEMQDFLGSDSEDDMEDVEDDMSEMEDLEDIEEWTKSVCMCSICNALNDIENRWNEWIPENILDESIKNAIDVSVL